MGHLSHIEKGERNPSTKTLKTITSALGVPFEMLYYTFDKELKEPQIERNYINYVSYSQIPAFTDFDLIDCPANFANASLAFKAPDNSMEPMIKEHSYAFVELNAIVNHKEIGLFKVNDKFVIRKLIYKKDHFILKPNNSMYKDTVIGDSDEFSIIGKIYV